MGCLGYSRTRSARGFASVRSLSLWSLTLLKTSVRLYSSLIHIILTVSMCYVALAGGNHPLSCSYLLIHIQLRATICTAIMSCNYRAAIMQVAATPTYSLSHDSCIAATPSTYSHHAQRTVQLSCRYRAAIVQRNYMFMWHGQGKHLILYKVGCCRFIRFYLRRAPQRALHSRSV